MVARYRAEGEIGLVDRSSAPGVISHRTPEDRVQAIAALRRLRMTGAEIAMCLGMPLSTVSAVLCRIGLGKLSRLEPPEPPNRYERARPGELVHVDVKKLGVINGAGHRVNGRRASQNVTRRGRRQARRRAGSSCTSASTTPRAWPTSKSWQNEQGPTAAGFLRRAVAFYAGYGITVQRVMSDNGACYRSTIHAVACDCSGCATYAPGPTGRARTESRAIHSYHAGRLGLRRDLRHQPRTHRSP